MACNHYWQLNEKKTINNFMSHGIFNIKLSVIQYCSKGRLD